MDALPAGGADGRRGRRTRTRWPSGRPTPGTGAVWWTVAAVNGPASVVVSGDEPQCKRPSRTPVGDGPARLALGWPQAVHPRGLEPQAPPRTPDPGATPLLQPATDGFPLDRHRIRPSAMREDPGPVRPGRHGRIPPTPPAASPPAGRRGAGDSRTPAGTAYLPKLASGHPRRRGPGTRGPAAEPDPVWGLPHTRSPCLDTGFTGHAGSTALGRRTTALRQSTTGSADRGPDEPRGGLHSVTGAAGEPGRPSGDNRRHRRGLHDRGIPDARTCGLTCPECRKQEAEINPHVRVWGS
ncbi:hypothetical protein SHIRM173S_06334 [Streptomyces hirsutus]